MAYINGRYVNTERAVSDLEGLTLTRFEISENKEEINIESSDGRKFKFYHPQDCCESVAIEEVHGDTSALIGTPILLATESTNARNSDGDGEGSDGGKPHDYSESWTWTFYRFMTIKGSVTIRWLGESNGYYSESVTFEEVLEGQEGY